MQELQPPDEKDMALSTLLRDVTEGLVTLQTPEGDVVP